MGEMAELEEEEDRLEVPQLPEGANDQKIAVYNAVMDFYRSNEVEVSFTKFTRVKDRTFIHELADQLGLYHRSEGKGRDRFVVLKRVAPTVPCGHFDKESKNWAFCSYSFA